jgi:hypothetical protein
MVLLIIAHMRRPAHCFSDQPFVAVSTILEEKCELIMKAYPKEH